MVNQQQTIYIWDWLETWGPTVWCAETTFSDPFIALKTLYHSINHADYNNFLPMLMALPAHIFGKSFLHYTLYVWIMFALPGIFLTAATVKTLLENFGFKSFSCAVLMAMFMLFPVMEVPVLSGFANIAMFLPGIALLTTLLTLDKSQLQLNRLFCVAMLSIIAVFQSRTATYMILGLFFGYTVYLITSSYIEKNLRRDFVMLCKKFLYIGLVGSLTLTTLFFEFVKKNVTSNLNEAYSGYALGFDYLGRVFNHIAFSGFLIYAIFLAAIIFGMMTKKCRAESIFLFTWLICAVGMFVKIQNMGWHQSYVMVLPFSIAIVSFASMIFSKSKFVGIILPIILVLNFAQSYFHILKTETMVLFQTYYHLPVRYDIDDLKKFVDYMNSMTENSDRKIYLLSSSGSYNSSALQNLHFPAIYECMPNLYPTADVDLRDGFPVRFFDADFVVVADPVQVHLRKEDQSIVVKPAELILNPSPISEHFKLIQEYNFQPEPRKDSSVTFKVYEKIKPFEKTDIEFFQKTFEEIYPGKDELFKNRFEQYMSEHF